MSSYQKKSAISGELMALLMNERSRFSSDEEFKAFALTEVRRFINDLRSINIELTLRPTYFGTALTHPGAPETSADI
ncbi:MAG: hypothetical protein L0220_09575 [Acidobacteria bacterium]|nr:hypothetical protein [Acidobacteriota bacterium]